MAIAEQKQSSVTAVPPSPRAPGHESRAIPASAAVLEVDPATCCVWAGNQRAADRLNERRCKDLIDSFISLGEQHTPAFARKSTANDGTLYEVVAGSRRLWAANWVREHYRPDFPFRIKVLNLTDEEACWLSDSENRERDDVSDYERALAYKHVLGYYDTQAEMAKRYNMSQAKLCRFLKLADVPLQIANAFADWPDLKLAYASELLALLKKPDTGKRVIREATRLHMIHEEREIAGQPPLAGRQVLRALVDAAKTKRGRPTGPIKEFTKNDQVYMRITHTNQTGLTMYIPHRNGATVQEMVKSFRETLREYYSA